MNKLKITLLIISFLLVFQACYYDNEEILYPSLSNSCDTLSVTYSVSIKNITTSRCLSCHSNSSSATLGSNIRLEDYKDVKKYVDNGKFLGSMMYRSGFSPMPKGAGQIAPCKIKQLEIWVAAGAPNN